MKNTIYFLTFCILSTASAAFAAPTLDAKVQEFLKSPGARGNETITVLLSYKNGNFSESRVNNRETLQRAMMGATELQEAKVLGTELKFAKVSKTTFWIVNGTAVTLDRRQLEKASLSDNLVTITSMNRGAHLVRSSKTTAVAPRVEDFTYGLVKLNIPALRTQYPAADGRGVRVGIIDTGIDANHKDLKERVKDFKDFTSNKRQIAYDDQGHGTHVAGTIAGGKTSGEAIGVAPGAELVIAKSFDEYGQSDDPELLAALQWMMDPDGNPSSRDYVDVISNSWQIGGTNSRIDPAQEPFCVALDNARKLGTIAVFAAGNSGPTTGTIGTPGSCPVAVTVGATDSNDRIASFSSRGPAKWKSVSLVKPNVSAPGVDVYSAAPGGGYDYMSGTSMATPHIAGVLAVLISASPDSSNDKIQKALYDGVLDLGNKGEDTIFGIGRADALNSVELLK